MMKLAILTIRRHVCTMAVALGMFGLADLPASAQAGTNVGVEFSLVLVDEHDYADAPAVIIYNPSAPDTVLVRRSALTPGLIDKAGDVLVVIESISQAQQSGRTIMRVDDDGKRKPTAGARAVMKALRSSPRHTLHGRANAQSMKVRLKRRLIVPDTSGM